MAVQPGVILHVPHCSQKNRSPGLSCCKSRFLVYCRAETEMNLHMSVFIKQLFVSVSVSHRHKL